MTQNDKKTYAQTYVVAEKEGDRITKVKVGRTNNFDKRIKNFKTANANLLVPLYQIEGDHEHYLHTLLAPYKIRREWFQPDCLPFLRKILGLPTEIADEPVRVYGLFTKASAEATIASIDGSDAIDPRQVIALLVPFRPARRARLVDGDFGLLVRRLRSKHGRVDERMRGLLKSTGGSLVRHLLYFVKAAARAGVVAKYSQLYDDLCRWDDGTGEVQEKWTLSCFGWKPAEKQEQIKIQEINENVN